MRTIGYGNVTGVVFDRGGFCRISKGSVQRDSLSWRYYLAKLNPTCHMSYTIIFTETSNLWNNPSLVLHYRQIRF